MSMPLSDVVAALLLACGAESQPNGVTHGTGPLAGVRLLDGPPPANLDEPDAVAFGLSATQSANSTGQVRPGYGGQSWEVLQLSCLAQSWAGDGVMGPRRDRAAELYSAVCGLLAADESLGGSCVRARVATWTYRGMRTPEGVLAVLEFPILVESRRFADD